jgi:hypothetical protein
MLARDVPAMGPIPLRAPDRGALAERAEPARRGLDPRPRRAAGDGERAGHRVRRRRAARRARAPRPGDLGLHRALLAPHADRLRRRVPRGRPARPAPAAHAPRRHRGAVALRRRHLHVHRPDADVSGRAPGHGADHPAARRGRRHPTLARDARAAALRPAHRAHHGLRGLQGRPRPGDAGRPHPGRGVLRALHPGRAAAGLRLPRGRRAARGRRRHLRGRGGGRGVPARAAHGGRAVRGERRLPRRHGRGHRLLALHGHPLSRGARRGQEHRRRPRQHRRHRGPRRGLLGPRRGHRPRGAAVLSRVVHRLAGPRRHARGGLRGALRPDLHARAARRARPPRRRRPGCCARGTAPRASGAASRPW